MSSPTLLWLPIVNRTVDDYESIMETRALLSDPTDQERLAEAHDSIDEGDVISGEDMGRLLGERIQRAAGTG